MDLLEERVERERAAHTEDDVLGRSTDLKDRFYHIWEYPAHRRLLRRFSDRLADTAGLCVLDLGCGRGERSLDLLALGASVDGIDISPVYTSHAEKSARAAGFDETRFTFVAGDAHAMPYGDATFDLVVGDGILHHLDLDVALGEIHRVLKPEGRALFREPLLDNPLLKLFRRLTPRARTDDERPLSAGDLGRIAASGRWRVESSYCGLVSAPVAVVTSVLLRPWPNNVLLRLADRIERSVEGRKALDPLHQYVLIDLVRR